MAWLACGFYNDEFIFDGSKIDTDTMFGCIALGSKLKN